MEIRQSAAKDCAYLLGVYLGDGCVTYTRDGYLVFRLNTIDLDFAHAVRDALQRMSDHPVNICTHAVKKSSKPNHSLRFGDQAICKWLREATANKTKLPDLTDEQRKPFIVGLMDSEGYVAQKAIFNTGRSYFMGFKACDVWIPQFIGLLQSVGVRVGKVSQCPPAKPGYKIPTRFAIKMQSWVDSGMRFNIARKQSKVDHWAATEPYSERSRYPRKSSSETARQTAAVGG